VAHSVNWDDLTNQHLREAKSKVLNEEEEKEDLEKRQQTLSYEALIDFFLQQDLSKETERIQNRKEEEFGWAERLLGCLVKRLATQQLLNERDFLFALTQVKLDTSVAEHEILLKSIYK